MNSDITKTVLSLFNVGKIRLAPGTIASFLTLILWYFVPNSCYLQLVLLLIFIFLSFLLCYEYAKNNKEKDPSYIVMDEFVGMIVSLYMIPKLFSYYLICFILFRFFDILKPSLIYKMQNVGYGLGIVLDDLISGLFVLIIVNSYLYL